MIKLNLFNLLSERSMTQAELAKLTDIRPSTICDICNNTCLFLKLEHIEKICRTLKCSINDLVDMK